MGMLASAKQKKAEMVRAAKNTINLLLGVMKLADEYDPPICCASLPLSEMKGENPVGPTKINGSSAVAPTISSLP